MKNYIYAICLLIFTPILISCEDSLEFFPTDSISEAVFWKQEKDAIFAVNAIYRELDDVKMVIRLDGITDIGYVRNGWYSLYRLGMGTHDALDADAEGVWNSYFVGIRRANDVLNNIDKIKNANPDLIKRLKGEAKFLRAYYYTNLTSLWGDVPLILKPLRIDEFVARNNKKEVVDFIIAELDEIISSDMLPKSYSGDDIGRATIGAALALKARVCIRNERWQEAAEASRSVIDLGIYELHPSYGDLFKYAGTNSNEIIFSKQFAKGSAVYNAFEWGPYSIGGNSSVEPIRKLFTKYEYSGPKDSIDFYKNIDPRWGFTVYYPGSIIGVKNGGQMIYNSYPHANNTSLDKILTRDFTTSHGWNVRKYIDYESDVNNPNQGSIDLILIRFADVLLMYAESKIELNQIDQSVYDAINAVRTRPTVELPEIQTGKSQAQLREIVRNERCVELAFEGLRLYDLNRWKIGNEKAGLVEGFDYFDEDKKQYLVWNINVSRTFNPDRDYLWPIPQREIDLNKLMSQNPGY